jgi:hypothetical protein
MAGEYMAGGVHVAGLTAALIWVQSELQLQGCMEPLASYGSLGKKERKKERLTQDIVSH